MTVPRSGPRLRIVGSCDGCEHRTTLRTHKVQYACNNHDGIYGNVPRIIGGEQKPTPTWCPRLPDARAALGRELVAVTSKKGT